MGERDYSYDILRIIATIGVLIIHVTAKSFIIMNHGLGNMFLIGINGAFRVSVPIFIFISGAMVTLSVQNKPFNYLIFLKKKFVKIYIPYVFISIIYSVAVSYDHHQTFELSRMINDILTGSAFDHLYFIPILVQLIILTPFCIWLSKSKWLSSIVIVLSLMTVLYVTAPLSDRFFMKYIGFYLVGLSYPKWKDQWTNPIKGIFITAQLALWFTYITVLILFHSSIWYKANVIETLWFINGIMTPIAWLFAIDFLKNKYRFNKFATMSVYTYGVYLVHPMILGIITRFYTFKPATIIVLFLLTLTISFLFSVILGKLKERLLKWAFIKY